MKYETYMVAQRKLLGLAMFACTLTGSAFAEQAGPQTCVAKVLVPEVTEIVTEQIPEAPEQVEVRVIPAVYETVTEQVLVRDVVVDESVAAPVREIVTERVEIMPQKTRIELFPAEYETHTEQVLISPAHVTWQVAEGPCDLESHELTDEETSVMRDLGICPVITPAKYRTETRRAIVREQRSETSITPAVYEDIRTEIVRVPSAEAAAEIGVLYETIVRQRLVTPLRREAVTVPAAYKTVEKQVVVQPAHVSEHEIVCDSAITREVVLHLQRALQNAGYTVADDGILGPGTLNAMRAYQQHRKLMLGRLTRETLASLDISYNE
ncbi:peptidoglycan-binding domain-containing protein [Hyphomonas pacifica]|nr:peptidoglycan-binding domain-containing protein [Hyphomonas pacifica]